MSHKVKKFVGARSTAAGTTSIDMTTWTPIALATTTYDTVGNIHSPGTPTKLTAPFTGLYYVVGQNRWPDATGGVHMRIGLRVDGTTFHAVMSKTANDTNNQYMNIGMPIYLTAGQYVELCGYHLSVTAINAAHNTEAHLTLALLAVDH